MKRRNLAARSVTIGRALLLALAGLGGVATCPAAAAGWRPVDVPQASQVTSLSASSAGPAVAWVSGVGGNAITRDGGATGAPAPTGPGQVAIDATPAIWWSTDAGQLQRSDDAGLTWHPVPGLLDMLSPLVPPGATYPFAYVEQLLASPVRSGSLWAIVSFGAYRTSETTVLHSLDGGLSWA